jgi:hypothetical protein
MSNQEIEKTLMVIESEKLTLNLKNALQLTSSMKLEESKVKDKSIYSVIKIIRQDIEEKVGNLSGKEAVIEYLNGINAFLGPPPPLPPPPLNRQRAKRFHRKKKKL